MYLLAGLCKNPHLIAATVLLPQNSLCVGEKHTSDLAGVALRASYGLVSAILVAALFFLVLLAGFVHTTQMLCMLTLDILERPIMKNYADQVSAR